jgi:3-hydroxybutyryl-CoA dehydrogenase
MSARSPASDVKLHDVSEDRIKAGLATINGNMARQVSQGRDHRPRISASRPALAHDRGGAADDDFADADLVIEAATEKEEVKRKIFASSARR